MRSKRSDRCNLQRPVTRGLWVALLALAACSAERTENGDDSSADEATRTNVDAGPEMESGSAEPTDMAPTTTPPSGGMLDSCTSLTWTEPSEPKVEAGCVQHWDDSGAEPVLRYVCSCDLNECPIYVPGGQSINGTPAVQLNDCVVEAAASGCNDSLQAACGATAGQHGYCEYEYYGLTPTRPEQTPPTSATIVCFEQSNGAHACQCPGEEDLVTTDETNCNRALLTACLAPCDSTAGQCTVTENGYDCACGAGFDRSVEVGLCDYALFHACEPQCSNEMGACYWDPAGGPNIICKCNDDAEPQILERDPNVMGDECRTPLVDACGGSAEGPNAWPQ